MWQGCIVVMELKGKSVGTSAVFRAVYAASVRLVVSIDKRYKTFPDTFECLYRRH